MHVISHAMLPRLSADGCCTQTVADATLCAAPLLVRTLRLAPGAASAGLAAAEGTVLLALAGSGKLRVDGAPQRFAAPCTLSIPPGAAYELVNNAAVELQLVSVCLSQPPEAARIW